jgi:hypothetical protein
MIDASVQENMQDITANLNRKGVQTSSNRKKPVKVSIIYNKDLTGVIEGRRSGVTNLALMTTVYKRLHKL